MAGYLISKAEQLDVSDPAIIFIAGGIQTVLLALVAAVLKMWGDKNHAATQASIEVVRNDVNGKMEHMQEIIKTAAIAEGKLAGIAEEKANPS